MHGTSTGQDISGAQAGPAFTHAVLKKVYTQFLITYQVFPFDISKPCFLFAEILLKLYTVPIRNISSGSDSSMASTISGNTANDMINSNVSQVFIRLTNRIIGTMVKDSKHYQTRVNFANLCFILLAGCDSNACLNSFIQSPTAMCKK